MILRVLKFFKKEPIIPNPMKYLIVGLGNMGAEYDNTRHNIGFDVVDYLAREASVSFKNDKLGDIAEIKHKGRTLVLLKPSTFMNLSGKAVKYWLEKLKIPQENLMVLVDDIHLDVGKLRLRDKGSDGGHNGLKDIQERFGHNNYVRLRMGVGRDFHTGQQAQYVLGKWPKDQVDLVKIMIEKAATAAKNYTTMGLKNTMDVLNR